MSVFTKVSIEEADKWVKSNFSLGRVTDLRGILSGIENTNYFLDTDQETFVLTLFEKLTDAELPFYLQLMSHLSSHGILVPNPIQGFDGKLFRALNGKPAAIVTKLPGAPVLNPKEQHVYQVGEHLARLHKAGQSYPMALKNLRGHSWWSQVAPDIYPFLSDDEKSLLKLEINYQAEALPKDLPTGPIHADLFRDNVLFDRGRIGGFIDFYFACVDLWIYDVAITANDWCVKPDGSLEEKRVKALLEGYQSIRDFNDNEKLVWPRMLRAGALRFWVSRLYDFHLPRPGEMTHAHDPLQFKKILMSHRKRVEHGDLVFSA